MKLNMKIKHKYLFISLLFLITTGTYAQQKPVFSQYYFNPLALNPAFAGSQNEFSTYALYRNQWVNLDGAPKLITFSANSGIRSRPIGLGILISEETIGIHSDFSLFLSYAYRIKFPIGTLSMGLQAGFSELKSDFTKLTLLNANDPNLSGVLNKFNPNFGTGVFFETKNFYAGISVPYLINSKVFDNPAVQLSEASSKRYYYLIAARVFDINNRLQIKPEGLIRYQEGAPLGIDANLKAILDKKIGLGVIYRSGDAVITTFEFQLIDNLRIGYAYEWTLTSLNKFSKGSHEVMVNYRFKIPGLQRPEHCPTYF
jgi:type IX secretion system PorP/SprF family membrane protein